MKKQKSPCIDICKFIGPNGWCLGCARTRDEAKKCKKIKALWYKNYAQNSKKKNGNYQELFLILSRFYLKKLLI